VKSDLDRLMEERQFDAIVIIGHATENHALSYMTGGAPISEGTLIKRRGVAPVLIVGPMEREEAAKSGLSIETYSDYDFFKLAKEAGSMFEARIQMLMKIFEKHGISGTVSFYGQSDPGQAFRMLTRLSEVVPGITITGETETSIFDEAFTTKDIREIEVLRSVAERTNQVMEATVSFILSHSVQDNRLIKAGAASLTVGDVKRFVRAALMEQGLEESDGMIFAIGRDGGVPHSRGEDSDVIELGKPIVFDLFPRARGGGYFHDMTRTFCLGFAPPEVQHAYDQVMFTFNQVMKELAVGEKAGHYQDLTCDLFEEMGHPTIRSNPSTVEGYVHSLGHGLGLQIHSSPRFRSYLDDTIERGQVFTVEPGLYYPDRGFGIRIEDTIYVDDNGEFHSLTPFPKDLVIPIGS
jgi:Xaa-Pro aminopeptidase